MTTDLGNHTVLASVLAFNNNPAALRTLLCLRAQTVAPTSVVVVDNASEPSFESYLAERGVDLESHERVVREPSNRGVGAGHNRGLREAIAEEWEYVLLLEHDTFVTPDCVETMLRYSLSDPKPSLAAVYPVLARNQYEATLLQRGEGLPGERVVTRPQRGHVITFNALLLPVALATRAEPIREDLVVGFEDYEYMKSLERAGGHVLVTTEVLVIHPNRGLGRYPEPQSPIRCFYAVRNFLWVRREETGRLPLREAARALPGVARDLARLDRHLAMARIRGIAAGLRGSESAV